jgi:hypothetical protein
MERGNAKHGPRQDEALADELAGQLGPGGSNREEWADPEPPADDDAPVRTDLPTGEPGNAGDQDGELQRLQHDMAVANDWNPGDDRA